jgi:hypothetical protein
VHVVTARRAIRVTVALSVLLASGFAAQGFAGQSARAGVVCGGQSCEVYLSAFIRLTGDVGPYNSSITIPPPPCWYSTVSGTYPAEGSPAGAAVPFDKFVRAAIKGNYGTWSLSDGGSGGGGAGFFSGEKGTADAVSGYPKYANPQPGSWYGLDANGSAQGLACVGSRPWLSWVAQGAQPPPPTIPARTLALYALAHLRVPGIRFTLNPRSRSYVALPTFAKTDLPGWGGGRSNGHPYQHVTATIIATGQQATVWAVGGSLSIDAGTGKAITYDHCTAFGSSASPQQMNATGPNARIDCGATYTAPSTSGPYMLSGTIYWRTTWAPVGGGGPQGQPIGGPLVSRGAQPVTVAEVQSLNN